MSVNKHDAAKKYLNKFRNSYYNSIDKQQRKIAQELNVVLPYLINIEKELELYKELYKELKLDIVCVDEEEDDITAEYLDIGGASNKLIDLVKKIKMLGDKNE